MVLLRRLACKHRACTVYISLLARQVREPDILPPDRLTHKLLTLPLLLLGNGLLSKLEIMKLIKLMSSVLVGLL